MKKEEIEKHQKDYARAAKILFSTRVPMHWVSGVTTGLFVLVAVLSLKEAETVILWLGTWLSYTVLIAAAILLAVYYEKIVSRVIDVFSFIVSNMHSKRLAVGLSLIVLPLLIVAGSTSFVGSSEMASSVGDNILNHEMTELQVKLESNSKAFKKERSEREKELLKKRAILRESIQKKYEIKLKAVPAKNLKKYHKNKKWYLKKRAQHNNLDSLNLLEKLAINLEKHDSETDKLLRDLVSVHADQEKDNSESSSKLVKFRTDVTGSKVNRLKFLGGFFGTVSIGALIISLLCSLCGHYCLMLAKSKPKHKKRKNWFWWLSSPTAKMKPKNSVNRDNNGAVARQSHGVGEEHDAIEIMKHHAKKILSEINDAELSGDADREHKACQQLAQIRDELASRGVKMAWADESKKEIIFK